MLDSIHKMFVAGVGLVAMTKDKTEEHLNKLVRKGKRTEKEGHELAEEMFDKSQQARTNLEKQVEEWVQQALRKHQIASKEDVEKLTARIEKLEAAKAD